MRRQGPWPTGPTEQEPKPHGASGRGQPTPGRCTALFSDQWLELAAAPIPAAGLVALHLFCHHHLRSVCASAASTLDPCRLHCVMFACHLCVHITAVSIDPADHNVRTKSDRGPVPVFDRSKHPHVIENCHCYLCQVDVGPKSKHCSSCNKCVANFDHHCRWLNNCVGSRNYKLFLHSVLSALLGICFVLVVASYVFVEFFLHPSRLRTNQHFLLRNDSSVWFVFLPVAPLSSAAAVIPGLAAVTITLALLSSVLLSHLLCFHIYLMWNRLSTYEYIVRQRHRHGRRDSRKTAAAVPSVSLFNDADGPSPQGFTQPQMDNEEGPTVAVHGEPATLVKSRVRTVSSPVVEEANMSSELNAAAPTRRRTQKKKRKSQKVPSEMTRDHSPNSGLPPDASSTSSVSLAQRIPFPAFPLRASLPPLAPALGPVQAAAPPAEYHSDSAESLEEIPMVLAKLGSSLTVGDSSRFSQRTVSAFPPQSSHCRTKRKASASRNNKSTGELMFEMSSTQPPTVFVSRASGDTTVTCQDSPTLGQRETGIM
ncbi:palmitoyltransferase ZDHHC1 isoform X2 [Takifugu rubripes]|uniref:palmitoyltransferase ZDHHC1 isoform X2 n=1 Tax=Takifugu rubripes TaxID=31033 RepID=UPI00114587D8|nr:probable palmitoyltransferase ZDHHC1 isoform X2 [Takifugu rubripes]